MLAVVAASLLAVILASPANAIVYGQPDNDDVYSNVGAVIEEFPEGIGPFPPGHYAICTGTLIAPAVFLTAAHCIYDGERTLISFDQAFDDPVQASAELHSGIAHAHPKAYCCGRNDVFDIAVVLLDEPVAGITPAQLPEARALSAFSNSELRAATFVAVGYGAVRETRRQAFQSIYRDPQRRYAEQSVLSLEPAWLNLTMNQATGDGGTCYGDSGGPHFLGTTVLSITVTGDVWCKSTDKTYRLDTPSARTFLGQFVSLP